MCIRDRCRDYIFAVLIEDISVNNAIKLDKRIKEECIAYLGMTSIDIDSTDVRKQFWKMLRRDYSIEGETLTCFGNEEAGFAYSKKAKEYGFRVNYDGFPDEQECDNQIRLFSTRQSSFITKVEQLEVKKMCIRDSNLPWAYSGLSRVWPKKCCLPIPSARCGIRSPHCRSVR